MVVSNCDQGFQPTGPPNWAVGLLPRRLLVLGASWDLVATYNWGYSWGYNPTYSPPNGLIGVTPIISRVITPVISGC